MADNSPKVSNHKFSEWHPALKGFSAFYEAEIRPALTQHEDARRRLMRQVKPQATAAVILGLIFFFGSDWLAERTMFGSDLIQTLGVVGGIGGFLWAYWKYSQFAASIKVVLMERICRFLGLRYSPHATAWSIPRFETLNLLPKHDSAKLEDEISGERHGVEFTLAEATLKRRGSKSERTVFQGFLVTCTFARPFEGLTILANDQGWLGNMMGSQDFNGERIALEDPRFERVFEVFGSDQVEARYLLTPTLMEKILQLANCVGHGKLTLAFEGHHALLVVKGDDNKFEMGALVENLHDPESVQAILDDVAMALWIVDSVNLALERYR